MQTLIPAREQKDTHAVECFDQPACALEVQWLIRIRVPRFALRNPLDHAIESLEA